MVDILHRVAMEGATPEAVYEKLTTLDGLADWWTTDTTGEAGVGGTIDFGFGQAGFIDMEVVELEPGRFVRWRGGDGGPEEWKGTTVEWTLSHDGDWTVLLFAHRGWREPVEFMHHCTTKWGAFLQSLKQLVETGEGAPHPRDLQISNWH